jgi:hypothetical protein
VVPYSRNKRFGLLLWQLDEGGPRLRAERGRPDPDFQFPQDAVRWADWIPRLSDYLYVSLTNAIAVSPTDTMPLTRRAKGLMAVESLISYVVVILVVARAVNVLGSWARVISAAERIRARPTHEGRKRAVQSSDLEEADTGVVRDGAVVVRVSSASWAFRSVAAGTAGTAVMTLAYKAEHRLRLGVTGALDYDDSLVPGQIVAAVMHLGHVTAREEQSLGLVLRWSYGSAFGLWHGTLRRIVREPWASVAFGATLLTATLTLFPLLGRTPPPWRWPPDVMATSIGTHVAYVSAVAAVDDGLRRLG